MRADCEVVRDLLPLYHDGVCSQESRRVVEDHLQACDRCRRELQLMEEALDTAHSRVRDETIAQAASSAWKRSRKSAFRKGFVIAFAAAMLLLGGITAGYLCIRSLPVDWDAAACAGGYATFIFDKYHEELVQRYLDGSGEKDDITSIEAVRGTQSAEWEGKTIFLQFEIRYEHRTRGTVTERVHFIGERTWIDTYDWSGALIEG